MSRPPCPQHFDAVLFDFDGVLADTERLHCACWAEILSPCGIRLEWDWYRDHCIGVADRAMLATLGGLADPPVTVDALWPLYPNKRSLFRDRAAMRELCPPDTVALVRSLTNLRLAVVTSSGRAEVEPALVRAGIRDCFQALVFGEDVARLKPAPDPYLRAAALLDARRPLVVEDSEAGAESARAAGFDFIRVAAPDDVPRAVRARLIS
ncbi:MAG: HAD family hydrolase [Bryobacteraceae bacterium]